MAYPLVAVRVDSDKALKYLSQIRTTVQAWGRSRTAVSSGLVYAYGIETGYHRGGKRARIPTGAFMIRDGIAETTPRIGPLIAGGFDKGPSIVPLMEANIGRMVVAAIQRRTPVRSGNLRDSFRFGTA